MQDKEVNITCGRAIMNLSKGNKDALSVLYDCMARMIFSVAYAITGNYTDAEDVLQDTMIEITKCAHEYKEKSNAKAWILAIARNRSIDVVRKRKSDISIEGTEIAQMPDPHEDFSQTEVLEMLGLLDTDEKQLVIFRLYAGMSYLEISHMMNISVYAAQKRYQRAIKKLRKYYT